MMSITISAVYENGAFHPLQPLRLQLDEGEAVELTVAKEKRAEPPPNEEEVAQRIRSAESVQEWIEATRLLPADDGGYDILKALDENRKWSGGRPLLPDESGI